MLKHRLPGSKNLSFKQVSGDTDAGPEIRHWESLASSNSGLFPTSKTGFTVESNGAQKQLHLANAPASCRASCVGLLLLNIFKFPSCKSCSMGDKLVLSWQLQGWTLFISLTQYLAGLCLTLHPHFLPYTDNLSVLLRKPEFLQQESFRKGKRSLFSCLRKLYFFYSETMTGALDLLIYLVTVIGLHPQQTHRWVLSLKAKLGQVWTQRFYRNIKKHSDLNIYILVICGNKYVTDSSTQTWVQNLHTMNGCPILSKQLSNASHQGLKYTLSIRF